VTQDGRHLFIGFSCTEHENHLMLYLVRSTDSRWVHSALEEKSPRPSFQYKLSKPQEDSISEGTMFKITTADDDGRLSEFAVLTEPRERPRRWGISVGLAGTYFSYEESRLTEKVTQTGLTGKASGTYRLVPRILHIDANVFSTLTIFTTSPNTLPSSRYLGINGRLGYRLPVGLGATEWFFLAGWYWWSMQVDTDRYGVNPLTGPQAFIQMVRAGRGERAFYLYFKLATISDGSDFLQVSNRELALGGGYALSDDRAPLMITLDVARTEFKKFTTSMSLMSLSAGVTKRF
jgi:hypothetical protein